MDKVDPNPRWEPGDIALCIRRKWISEESFVQGPPLKGRPYTVEKVANHQFQRGVEHALFLKDGPPNISGRKVWPSKIFIKVTPPEDMVLENEEQETELETQL